MSCVRSGEVATAKRKPPPPGRRWVATDDLAGNVLLGTRVMSVVISVRRETDARLILGLAEVHLAIPIHVGGIGDRLVARRLAGLAARRQTFHRHLGAAVAEERDGVALLAGTIGDAMRRRQEAVVG